MDTLKSLCYFEPQAGAPPYGVPARLFFGLEGPQVILTADVTFLKRIFHLFSKLT